MTKISVIMPVYNTEEEYLREAIESILNQTFSDFEFIIINDGSTNNSEEVILSYKDQRIKYFKQENKGLPKTLNKGLSIACGEYIARMDSDDISLPERFEKQVNFLNINSNISLVGSYLETFPKKGIVKYPKCPKYLDFLKVCCIGQGTVMFRKSDFDKYGLKYDDAFTVAEDYNLWTRGVKYLNFMNIEEVLLKYRIMGQNTSTLLCKDRINLSMKIQKQMLEFLTCDKELQKRVVELLYEGQKNKKYGFEYLFSIKNLYEFDTKIKVITIFGIELKFRKKLHISD